MERLSRPLMEGEQREAESGHFGTSPNPNGRKRPCGKAKKNTGACSRNRNRPESSAVRFELLGRRHCHLRFGRKGSVCQSLLLPESSVGPWRSWSGSQSPLWVDSERGATQAEIRRLLEGGDARLTLNSAINQRRPNLECNHQRIRYDDHEGVPAGIWKFSMTLPKPRPWRRNFGRLRKWKPSAPWPAASPMISTTCCK